MSHRASLPIGSKNPLLLKARRKKYNLRNFDEAVMLQKSQDTQGTQVILGIKFILLDKWKRRIEGVQMIQ